MAKKRKGASTPPGKYVDKPPYNSVGFDNWLSKSSGVPQGISAEDVLTRDLLALWGSGEGGSISSEDANRLGQGIYQLGLERTIKVFNQVKVLYDQNIPINPETFEILRSCLVFREQNSREPTEAELFWFVCVNLDGFLPVEKYIIKQLQSELGPHLSVAIDKYNQPLGWSRTESIWHSKLEVLLNCVREVFVDVTRSNEDIRPLVAQFMGELKEVLNGVVESSERLGGGSQLSKKCRQMEISLSNQGVINSYQSLAKILSKRLGRMPTTNEFREGAIEKGQQLVVKRLLSKCSVSDLISAVGELSEENRLPVIYANSEIVIVLVLMYEREQEFTKNWEWVQTSGHLIGCSNVLPKEMNRRFQELIQSGAAPLAEQLFLQAKRAEFNKLIAEIYLSDKQKGALEKLYKAYQACAAHGKVAVEQLVSKLDEIAALVDNVELTLLAEECSRFGIRCD